MRVAYLIEKGAEEGPLGLMVKAQGGALAARGHEVLVVGRVDRSPWAGAGVQWRKAERLESATVFELLARCDAVVGTHESHVGVVTDVGTAAPFVLVSPEVFSQNGPDIRARLAAALRAVPVAILASSDLAGSWAGELDACGPVYACGVLRAEIGSGALWSDADALERAILRGIDWHRSRIPRAPTLGLAMIVRDEEENLRGCLAKVKPIVDEMVVVDTGSRDNTVAVAEQMGAKVVRYGWRDDFADARNVSLANLSADWVLVLDADERLVESSYPAIQRAILNPVVDAFLIDIINATGDVLISGALAHSSVRLFRRRPDFQYEGYLHEQIAPCIVRAGGRVRPLPGATILHYGYLGAVVATRDKANRNMYIIRRQVAQEPHNSFAYFNLGMEYVRRGERQRAIKAFQRAFRLLPGLNTSYAPVLLKNLAACLMEEQRYNEALSILEMGEQAYPEYTDLTLLRGVVLNRAGRYCEALAALEACIEKGEAPAFYMTQIGAGSFLARMAMVQSYRALGQFDKAAEAYTLAAREMIERLGNAVTTGSSSTLPSAAILWEAAERKLRSGDLKGAVQAYRLLMDPEHRQQLLPTQLVSICQRKALLEVLVGEMPRARDDIRLLEGVNPTAAAACWLLVRVVVDNDAAVGAPPSFSAGQGTRPPAGDGCDALSLRWDDVVVPLTTLLDAGREMWFARACEWLASGSLERSELELELGKLFFQRGRYEAATRHLLTGIRARPSDPVAFWQLGELCARHELPEDARVFFRQAIRLSPNVPRYWVSLAACYHASGNDRAGLRVLNLALRHTADQIVHAARVALETSIRLHEKTCSPRGAGRGGKGGVVGECSAVECVGSGDRA